jgi:dTDP-glucose 4,6-dehydratase
MQNKQIPVYGQGLNVRDWIYVKDFCRAIQTVLTKGKIGEVYNIGGDSEVSNIDMVKMILKYMDKDESLITYVTDRLGHDFRYAINYSKIEKELKWEPIYSLDEGLLLTVNWYEFNQNWWAKSL